MMRYKEYDLKYVKAHFDHMVSHGIQEPSSPNKPEN